MTSGKRALSSSSPPPTDVLDDGDRGKNARRDGEGREGGSSTITIDTAHAYLGREPVAVQKPTQIASFSYDESRALHHDDRSRRFYHPPPRNANLNFRFEQRIERDEGVNEHLDGLLASLLNLARKGIEADKSRAQADVITWRGMMTKLCTLLYEGRQGFEMNVMMLGDTLYIEEHQGPLRKADKARQNDDQHGQRLAYHGYSLESYTCHGYRTWQPGCEVWDGDVNTNVQWGSIVKTRLGNLRMVLGGEVDAIDPQTLEPVEIKATMQIRNPRDEERFEVKMLRFYMQSFLLGVQRVVVGFRDHRGTLVTHQDMPTLHMPRAVRGKAHGWDPNACLNVASDVLTAVRRFLQARPSRFGLGVAQWPDVQTAERCDAVEVYRLTYEPTPSSAKFLTLRRLSADEVLNQVKEGREAGRVGFLTSEYYDFARQQDGDALRT